jgi:hypothetical protein
VINPHLFTAHYARIPNPKAPGGKMYQAAFVNRWLRRFAHKKQFRTAAGALAYANKLLPRWCKLYDAAVVARSKKEG